jgi:hypothetical protein
MLSPAQMEALARAAGAEFDQLFLAGMIQHHGGALDMVRDLFAVAGAGQDAEIFNFATDVDSSQRAEIRIMQAMLENITSGENDAQFSCRICPGIFLSILLLILVPVGALSQTPSTPKPNVENGPGAAPPLPAGMTGANPDDPRAKLKPGLFDAGEAVKDCATLPCSGSRRPFNSTRPTPGARGDDDSWSDRDTQCFCYAGRGAAGAGAARLCQH